MVLHGQGHAKAFPFPFARLAAGNGDVAAIDDDAVFIVINRALKGSVSGIILEKIGQRGVVRTGVDGGDLNFFVVGHKTQQIPTNAAKAVHSNFHGHDSRSLGRRD